MKKQILLACAIACAAGASAQMNVWENGNLSAQYNVENVDSVTFGITSETPVSGTGKDGITPLLKIENDYWFVSYDNGETWQQEGLARGEKGEQGEKGEKGEIGEKGEKGDKGDSMFLSFEQDSAFVYLLLPDSSKVKIAKVSEESKSEDDFIHFQDLNVKAALLSKGIDTNHDNEISYKEAAAVKGRLSMDSNGEIMSFRELQYFTGLSSISFWGCSKLFEVILPLTIDSICNNAFCGTKLSSIDIPASCKYIGGGAFKELTTLTGLTLHEGCKYIGQSAFEHCGLSSVNVPNSVDTIGLFAFASPNLVSFTFPENLKDGGLALLSSDVSDTEASENVTSIIWNCINYENPVKLHRYSSTDHIGVGCYYIYTNSYSSGYNKQFSLMPNITKIEIGEKVQVIPPYCFYNIEKITSIDIPSGVKTIGAYAFAECKSLSAVSFGENVQMISTAAFENCSLITTITLGENIQNIGTRAFNGCAGNMKIYCKAINPPLLNGAVFPNTTGIVIYVPRASVDEYRILWSDYASRILPYDFEE